jgi:hypothetical protein
MSFDYLWIFAKLQRMERIFSALLPLLLLIALPAQAAVPPFTYTTNDDGTLTVAAYNGSSAGIVIQSPTGGRTVTAIGDGAFDSDTFASITIPNTVTYIGSYAFFACQSLTNANIPTNVVTIGDGAFEDCFSLVLSNVVFPASLTTIGANAFTWDSLSQVTIPGTVTNLGDAAFCECMKLTNAIIGNGVGSIGNYEFWDSTNLLNVTISDSVTNIGQVAFSYCLNLPNIAIPASVTNIGIHAFDECTSLKAITVDPENPVFSSVGGVLFNKNQTALITFPGGVAGSYTVPSGVTSIGDEAFMDCGALSAIYFLGNAPSLGSEVFENDNLTAYYLPGTTGWSGFSTNSGLATMPWNPLIKVADGNFGVRKNSFGFDVTGSANLPVVIEAATNLANPVWVSVQSLTLTNGLFYFSEPLPTNNAFRFYRISHP